MCHQMTLLAIAGILNQHYIVEEIGKPHLIGTREPSGSVVDCLTRDRGTSGLSLTGVTALCP